MPGGQTPQTNMAKEKQIQVRVSLTQNLYEALKYKAHQLGVPVTQLVKFFIIKEVDKNSFSMSLHATPRKPKAPATKKMQKLYNDSEYLDSID
jgi:hypothetical protein